MHPEHYATVDELMPLSPESPTPQTRRRRTAGRTEIRNTIHRVTPSRQSQKKVERSRQRRQPKTGGTGNRYRKLSES